MTYVKPFKYEYSNGFIGYIILPFFALTSFKICSAARIAFVFKLSTSTNKSIFPKIELFNFFILYS